MNVRACVLVCACGGGVGVGGGGLGGERERENIQTKALLVDSFLPVGQRMLFHRANSFEAVSLSQVFW